MNWGTKIVMGMVAFMLFIVGMVVYMFKVHDNDPLVAEDYYEKGINYNQEYDASRNTISDKAEPEINITKNQVIIKLKDSASYQLQLLRPSASKDDIKEKGNTKGNANLILVNKTAMHTGLWMLELKWVSNGKNYYFKKNITL